MEFLGIILVLGPLVAFILRTIGRRGKHFYIGRIVSLAISLAVALLWVIDYVSCTFAFASFSPIFHIEYSYKPHDFEIGCAFADVLLCPFYIVRNSIRLVRWRKRNAVRKERYKKQIKEIGVLKVKSSSKGTSMPDAGTV